MGVDTAGIVKGFATARGLISGFGSAAANDFKVGSTSIQRGIADIGIGAMALKTVFADAAIGAARNISRFLFTNVITKNARDFYGGLAKQMSIPLIAAAQASMSSLIYVYGGIGKYISSGLARATAPITAAAMASVSSLAYVFGPLLGKIGAGATLVFGRLGAAVKNVAPSLFIAGIGATQVGAGFARIGLGIGKIAFPAAIGGLRLIGGAARATFGVLSNVVTGIAGTVLDLTKKFLLLSGVLAGVGAYALWGIVKGAVAFSEQADRAFIVFGKFSSSVIEQGQKMAVAFGVDQREFVQAASAFGTIFTGAGYAQKDAADLSVHFTKLATDLSSLVHIPVEEALDKIKSGLSQQFRPLKDVGVLLDEEALKTYAVKAGFAKLGAELTSQQKVQATIIGITDKLSIAHGNLAATAKGAGNEIRSLSGRFENLKGTVGTALLGFLVPALDEINIGIHAIQIAWNESSYAASSATVGVLGHASKQTEAIGFIQKGIMWVADAFQSMQIAGLWAFSGLAKGIVGAMNAMEPFVQAIESVFNFLSGTFSDKLSNGFNSAIRDTKDLTVGLDKLLEMAKVQPKWSLGVGDAFEKARLQIEKAKADLAAATPLNVSALKPVTTAAAAAKVGKEHSAANTAMEAGSQDAVNTILRSKFGSGKGDDMMKDVAKNTRQTNDQLNRIRDAILDNALLTLTF